MTKQQLKAEIAAINILLQGWTMDRDRLNNSIALFTTKKEKAEKSLKRLASRKKASKK